MGEVYEAEHVRLGRRVAVKLLRADSMDDHRAVRRFQSETRALATLRSDHIVSVFDCGELEDGTPFIVMERLEGEDLRRLLERVRPLPIRRTVHLALDVCHALSVVHAAGIVHRDLKPANLFVARGDRGEDVCKILDFGVAKLIGSDSTHQGALLGTIRYMAPEQIRESKEVGPAADIYALGAILYECLAGKPARVSDSREALMFEILNGSPSSLVDHCPSVPPRLAQLVMKALASDPKARFDSVDDMLVELEAVLASAPTSADSTESDSSTAAESRPRGLRALELRDRHRARVLAGVAAVGLLVGWLLRGLTATSRASDTPEPAASSMAAVPTEKPRTQAPVPSPTVTPSNLEPAAAQALPSASAAPATPINIPSTTQPSQNPAHRRAPGTHLVPKAPSASSQDPVGIDVSSPYSSDVHRP